ncbi:MAG: DUF4241 domain-containing protein [Actinomycetota bacterium]|nr:DUF4241 domain-containing protein [Actinomycetota bacterium]
MATMHALYEGRITEAGKDRTLTVHDLGTLKVPSGKVEASDPFVNLGESGVVIEVPPGEYPVRVTVADVSDEQDGSHDREAYLSLVLADGVPAAVEEAHEHGVMVDAGTVAFADAEAIARCMPEGDWYDLFDDGSDESWFSRMDDPTHLREGCANIVMPRADAGENVVLSHSGWGDGIYPVVRTRDASGRVLGLHIDLFVVGGDDEESAPAPAPAPPAKKKGLRRLFGG